MRPLSSALGMKTDGGDVATRRMRPARECLDGDDPPVPKVDDRLVGERQALVLDRLAQVGLELQAGRDLGLHRRLEERIRSAAADLGAVHRDVGVAQQVVRRSVPARGDDDPDAAADRDLALVELGTARRTRPRCAPPARARPRGVLTSSTRMANSSPPSRAIVSSGRSAACRRSPMAMRSPSPTVCPRLSLTVLNRSRSRNSRPTRRRLVRSARERVLHSVLEQGAVGEPRQVVVERLHRRAAPRARDAP